jgi:AraC-like DNA-binding protein
MLPSVKRIRGTPNWYLSERQRHESYEGTRRLLPELPLVGHMHLLDALPNALYSHTHPGIYELHCVVRGTLSFWAGRHRYDVEAGMALLTMPDELHGAVNETLPPAEWYWIHLHFPARKALPGLSREDTRVLQRKIDAAPKRLFRCSHALLDCFERLLAEHRSRDPQRELMARLMFHELLVCLARNLTPRRKSDLFQRLSPPLQRAFAWIDDHLAEPLSLGKIATAAGLSESSLRRRFREETGFSPADYVGRRRIAKAKEWLRASHRSVTDIAFALGFSTSAYFTAVFRRVTGMTPKAFRGANHRSAAIPAANRARPPTPEYSP